MSGVVIDSETKIPIPYAYVYTNSSTCGTVTNESGYYELNCPATDSIVISHLGYRTLKIPFQNNQEGLTMSLVEDPYIAASITIVADDSYLYELIEKAKKSLKTENDRCISKAYFYVNSSYNDQPIESTESFYNATFSNTGIERLTFKNGQSYLAMTEDNGYYINLDLSRAMMEINLTKNMRVFPYNPFQLSKRKLKKKYVLSLDHKTKAHTKIEFTPRKASSKYFSGSITIDNENFAVLEVMLNNKGAKSDVFKGIGDTYIKAIDYSIKYSYYKDDRSTTLNNILLSYQANIANSQGSNYGVKTESFVHLYDRYSPFIAPYINYPAKVEDYRLFTLPPDTVIWAELVRQNGVKLSLDQINKRNMVIAHGNNFNNIFYQGNPLFARNYQHWSADNRLLIKTSKPSVPFGGVFNNNFLSDELNIKTILYLDIIPSEYGFVFETSAILDVYNSFNYLENTPEVLAYVNIYFDLVEMYRRELENKLNKGLKTKKELENLYADIKSRMEKDQYEYMRAAFVGKNLMELSKWNYRVKEALGIDNMKLFDLSAE